jgi:hypothetical protein
MGGEMNILTGGGGRLSALNKLEIKPNGNSINVIFPKFIVSARDDHSVWPRRTAINLITPAVDNNNNNKYNTN